MSPRRQRHLTANDDASQVGDTWTFVAIDSDTKLIPTFRTGKRDAETTQEFINDLASRLRNRVQISSDAFRRPTWKQSTAHLLAR